MHAEFGDTTLTVRFAPEARVIFVFASVGAAGALAHKFATSTLMHDERESKMAKTGMYFFMMEY